jgi:EmrB/QacA subfamily drug resistance transporter
MTAQMTTAQMPAQMTAMKDRRWLGMSAILAATIMNLLDSTIVNVAAPSIRRDLGGSYASLQWLAAGYTLALAVGLLTGGRLGDMYGRRRMLLIGITGFVIASLACSMAFSPASLISARVVQGLFAAVMVPQCFGLIRDVFAPADMGKAFGIFGPAIGLSTIAGPIIAGQLIDANILGTGWRAVFAINVPLGAYAIIAGMRSLPSKRPAPGMRLDVVGALTAGVGMFLLVYPLVQGRDFGWPVWLLSMIVGAVVVLASFGRYQGLRARSGRTPLVELSVFAKRSYTSGVAFVVIFFGSIVGFSLSVGLFLQLGLGMTPAHASLTMSPWAAGAFIGSGFAAMMMHRLGRKIIHIGLAIMAAGLIFTYAIFTSAHGGVSSWALTFPLGVYGIGMGMIFVPLFDIVMGDIGDHEVGSASSLLESLQQLGASLGVAVLGTVFFTTIGVVPRISTFLHAVSTVTLITSGLVVVAFALAFLLPQRQRQQAIPSPAPSDEREPALV